jgi:hypothetical protein
MRRFAFFLSSERYKNYCDTPFCHADSDLLRQVLVESCDYAPENCTALKLEIGDGLNAERILSQIEDLVGRVEDGDSILFFFAGHGVVVESKTYLVLPDTSILNQSGTALKMSDVSYHLSKNKKLNIRLFDCCHSGENSRNPDGDMETEDFMRAVLAEGNECSITFASCAAHEKSYWDETAGNGIFTKSLVEAIKTVSEEAEIYAELIKIDVCNTVQRWCEERGKKQTPTLSVQVSGNISIGKKKRRFFQTPEPEVQVPLSLIQRLKDSRTKEIVDEKLYPELARSLKSIQDEVKLFFQSEKLYGIVLKESSAAKVDDIPEFLRNKIISRMKSYKTMHSMEAIRSERPRLKDAFGSIFEYKPIFDVNYYITQKYEMPACFLTFESTTDGYVPASNIFFYVCPLQASVAILSGYYFDKAYNQTEHNFIVRRMQQHIYTIPEFRSDKFLESVGPLAATYEVDLASEINERLHSINKELDVATK